MPDMLVHYLVPVVLLLAAHLLVYSPYPVMGADTHRECYRFTEAKPSPRTCDPDSKNCKVPIAVSADHKPDMNLCFQGIDATYEVYPVSATSPPGNTFTNRTCRALKPSRSVTSINDPCFDGLMQPAKDAISASGIKQQGVYKICSTDIKDGNICSLPPLGDEQSCPNGLHTLMGTCAPTGNCLEGMKVISYYCPEVKSYSVYEIQHSNFIYNLEVNKTDLSNNASGITPYILPTVSFDDQPTPYKGWTIIGNTTDGVLKYYARLFGTGDNDCTDYCAMVPTDNIFHTHVKCYTTSADDLCTPSWKVAWPGFEYLFDGKLLLLPHFAKEYSALLEEDGTYTTTDIVNPFTYTAHIEIDATRVDPEITASCAAITADGVGLQAKPYPQLPLLYVRRVCDQVVLSLYDCVLRYSHQDDSAMYWSVNKSESVPECTVYVVDNTSVLEVVIPKSDHDHDKSHDDQQSHENDHDHDPSHDDEQSQSQSQSHGHDDHQSQSHEQSHDHEHQDDSVSKKRIPTWAIVAIVVIVVVAIVIIIIVVIAVLCMRLRTPLALDEENLDTRLKQLEERTLRECELKG